VAAVLLMVVAVAGLVGRGGDSGNGTLEAAGPTTTTVEVPASLPSEAGAPTEANSPSTSGPAATVATRAPRQPSPSTTGPKAGGPTTTVPTSPGSGGSITTSPPQASPTAPEPTSSDPGPAPPFYDSNSPEAASPAPAMSSQPGGGAGAAPSGDSQAGPPSGSQKSTQPPAGPALRVGVILGDPAQEAGFRAYVNRLNQNGGVRGHALDLVAVSPGAGADTVATVNLSPQPVAGPGGAPGWATGPLLETLTATENLLRGAVFSFSSPPERQGHLAADALFPTAAAGKTAVIYAAPSGPLADAVPKAMQAFLKDHRDVAATIVTYDPADKPKLVDADAALLSLDPAAARAWVAQAKSAGYRPAQGVAGIYSLADDTLASDLPEGARVISPYVVPGGDEGQAIRSGAGGTSASVLHGWAGAKALAAAIWRTGADTPAEMQAALEGLARWSSGLAPPYETRPNSRSRTPEGVLFRVQSGAFVSDGGFRRDQY
jgi:hypothetical protein